MSEYFYVERDVDGAISRVSFDDEPEGHGKDSTHAHSPRKTVPKFRHPERRKVDMRQLMKHNSPAPQKRQDHEQHHRFIGTHNRQNRTPSTARSVSFPNNSLLPPSPPAYLDQNTAPNTTTPVNRNRGRGRGRDSEIDYSGSGNTNTPWTPMPPLDFNTPNSSRVSPNGTEFPFTPANNNNGGRNSSGSGDGNGNGRNARTPSSRSADVIVQEERDLSDMVGELLVNRYRNYCDQLKHPIESFVRIMAGMAGGRSFEEMIRPLTPVYPGFNDSNNRISSIAKTLETLVNTIDPPTRNYVLNHDQTLRNLGAISGQTTERIGSKLRPHQVAERLGEEMHARSRSSNPVKSMLCRHMAISAEKLFKKLQAAKIGTELPQEQQQQVAEIRGITYADSSNTRWLLDEESRIWIQDSDGSMWRWGNDGHIYVRDTEGLWESPPQSEMIILNGQIVSDDPEETPQIPDSPFGLGTPQPRSSRRRERLIPMSRSIASTYRERAESTRRLMEQQNRNRSTASTSSSSSSQSSSNQSQQYGNEGRGGEEAVDEEEQQVEQGGGIGGGERGREDDVIMGDATGMYTQPRNMSGGTGQQYESRLGRLIEQVRSLREDHDSLSRNIMHRSASHRNDNLSAEQRKNLMRTIDALIVHAMVESDKIVRKDEIVREMIKNQLILNDAAYASVYWAYDQVKLHSNQNNIKLYHLMTQMKYCVRSQFAEYCGLKFDHLRKNGEGKITKHATEYFEKQYALKRAYFNNVRYEYGSGLLRYVGPGESGYENTWDGDEEDDDDDGASYYNGATSSHYQEDRSSIYEPAVIYVDRSGGRRRGQQANETQRSFIFGRQGSLGIGSGVKRKLETEKSHKRAASRHQQPQHKKLRGGPYL